MGTIRPRRYWTIPKDTIESILGDVEQLINFFVIEVQRIVTAENVPYTGAVSLLHGAVNTTIGEHMTNAPPRSCWLQPWPTT